LTSSVIDTSAWVSFLRGDPPAVGRIDPMLAEGRAALTGPILAEVLSGASSLALFDRLKQLFAGVDHVSDSVDQWERAAEARFALARKGYQASLIDLTIALACVDGRHALLTRDRDFRAIRRVLPLELEIF
jgi:predicted nucleic acid-binding protein